MGQISARMLRGQFWFENQDFGVSVGAIGIIFRDTSFPTSPRSQNRLFRKIVPGVQGRRNGRGKKMFTLLGPNCDQGDQTCCGADFGSRIKISGHPLGQPASFFEIYPFRPGRGQIFLGGQRDHPLCHPFLACLTSLCATLCATLVATLFCSL